MLVIGVCAEFEDLGMKSKRTLHVAIAALSLGLVTALAGGADPAYARYGDGYDDEEPVSMSGKTPVLAVVALGEQHISIYDAKGKIMEAPVSSGQTGLETPAGVFSVVQKEVDHHSNLFDDASMPFMERITWTGISLHAGVLPGHPASHGCVRMPHSFAERLYDVTRLGMRVILVPQDIAPADIAQPAMFTPAAAPAGEDVLGQLRTAARTKFADSVAAQRREKELRQAASKKSDEASAAARAQSAAEATLAKAEDALKEAEHAAEAPGSEEKATLAASAKAQALAKVETARAQLQSAKLDAQSKSEAAQRANEEARAASAAAGRAADASEQAQQNLSPVSVFISRKTQRLYIRKNNLPVWEGPVTIQDSGKRIGTFVWTAVDYTGTPGTMRWKVVSMYKNAALAEPAAADIDVKSKTKSRHDGAAPAPADVPGAEAALSRISITPEAQERISAAVLPSSSLIVSDEGPSGETGKDTDFVVIMSGEPQGGLTSRHRPSSHQDFDGFEDFFSFGRSSRSEPSGRSGRSGGGGGFPFFFSD